jgi:LysR family transcriptional regulator, carnitine catabolism transcriptional activator
VEVRQIEYVVGVADHGTFSRAAEMLHVTQPSLSQGVRSLERELGVQLFHRTARGVVLSSAGSAFVDPARQVLRDLQTLRATIDAVNGLRAGRLDLVCLPTLAVDPMVALLGPFRKAYPEVSIHLVEPETTDELLQLVRNGRCELGVTDVLAAGATDLVIHELEQQHLVAVRPPGARRPAGDRAALSELAGVPLVATPPGTSSRQLINRAFEAAGIEPVIAVETSQREAVVPLVVAGAGTTFLPAQLADAYRPLGVVVVELDPPLTRTIGMVQRNGPLSPAAAAFAGMAKDHFEQPRLP